MLDIKGMTQEEILKEAVKNPDEYIVLLPKGWFMANYSWVPYRIRTWLANFLYGDKRKRGLLKND
jgi:hypothetical protein